jgi:hypothetical protein
MRTLLLAPMLLTACATAPSPRAAPTIARRPPPSSSVVVLEPPISDAIPDAIPDANSAAISDDGPPPDPPMALVWSFQLAPVAGRAGATQRLALTENGDATWDSTQGGEDAEVDEELSPAKPKPPTVQRCRGHLGPARHRKLVVAARQAMETGCTRRSAVDRLGRPADAATTTIAVTWSGERKSCEVGRSGGTYAAFEARRAAAVLSICTSHAASAP